MSSSSSSSAKLESQNGVTVAAEESQENNNPKQGSPQEVVSERRAETTPSLGSADPVGRGRDLLKLYPARSDKIYTCNICNKWFSTSQARAGHQHAHKQDRKRKKMEAEYPGLGFLNPYLDKPHLLLGGYSQNALSNENHLGITLHQLKRSLYPHLGSGGITENMTVVPRMTPTRFFTGPLPSSPLVPTNVPPPPPRRTTNLSRSVGSSSMGLEPVPPFPLVPTPPPPRFFTGNTIGSSSRGLEPIPSFPLAPTPPPPRTNVLNEENLISKAGKEDEIMEIDDDEDDDQTDEEKFKSWGRDLSLSL